ncbi:MAG: hypothetical protein AB7O50_00910 [Pseudolabrys sp.]
MTVKMNNTGTASNDGFASIDAMFRAYQMPMAWRMMNEEAWVQYWRGQDVLLTCMQEFADGWFRRRHTATATALDTALRCCEAKTPFAVAREVLTWQMGSIQRVMEDGLSCQKCCMELAKLTPHVAPDEDMTEEPVQDNAARPGKQPGAAHKAA